MPPQQYGVVLHPIIFPLYSEEILSGLSDVRRPYEVIAWEYHWNMIGGLIALNNIYIYIYLFNNNYILSILYI